MTAKRRLPLVSFKAASSANHWAYASKRAIVAQGAAAFPALRVATVSEALRHLSVRAFWVVLTLR
jgi:hypothetical protein